MLTNEGHSTTSRRQLCSRPPGPCRRAPCLLRPTRSWDLPGECVVLLFDRKGGTRERESEREREKGRSFFLFDRLFFFLSLVPSLSSPSTSSSSKIKKTTTALPPERGAPSLRQAAQRRPERERRLRRKAKGRRRRDREQHLFDPNLLPLPRDKSPKTFLGELGPRSGRGLFDRRDRSRVDARGAVLEGCPGVAAAALVSAPFFSLFFR